MGQKGMLRALLAAASIAAAIGLCTPSATASPNDCDYVNVDNQCVPAPEQSPSAPPGATAQCSDATWSYSKHHSGTCSGHGGVSQWL
jgi:Protein of unknown function (DUF3761)